MSSLPDEIKQKLKGHYEVMELLGQGGMAAVYKLKDPDGKVWAIKILHSHLAADESMVERFLDEARNCRRLDNPHCIKVIESDQAGPYPYFIMEYIEGEDLETELKRRGALPLPEINKLISQICEGIGSAHEMGLIHRDIKPANVLIERDTRRAVITDFGIARAADGSRLTLTGTCMGTPAYMSPEQVEGKKNLDYRSDIYSLGVVLYEMCTGGLPFTGESDISLATARLQNEPIRPARFNSEIPPAIETMILQAISSEPGRRYASASALAKGFREALDMPTPSDGIPQPAASRAGGSTRVYTPTPQGQSPPPQQPDSSAGSRKNLIIAIAAAGGALIIVLAVLAVIFLKTGSDAYKSSGNKDTAIVTPTPSDAPAKHSPESQIRQLHERFARTQRQKDINGHMSCFADRVQWYNDYISNSELRSRIDSVFYKSNSMDMQIDNLDIDMRSHDYAVVNLDKYWKYIKPGRNDDFCGEVRAVHTVSKINGQWLITGVREDHVKWVEKDYCGNKTRWNH